MPKKKIRLDLQVAAQKDIVRSREEASRLIRAGRVQVDGQGVDKPGTLIPLTAKVEVKAKLHPYVGRGGMKLQKALDTFEVDVTGCTAVDVGASTGGFTDCLLQRGCQKVYAIDVGYGQLDWSLRNRLDVVLMERTNARYLTAGDFPEAIDLAVVDVSFISLDKILPALLQILVPGGRILSLVKPQFEAGRGAIGKKGIVRDPAVHEAVLQKVQECATGLGFTVEGLTDSPITGADGNKEFLLHLLAPYNKS